MRHDHSVLDQSDFAFARDRIRRDSNNALLPDEKYAVAVHETGHALVAALSDHADPVAKITILPAGQSLGSTEQLPEVERNLYADREEVTAMLRTASPGHWICSARIGVSWIGSSTLLLEKETIDGAELGAVRGRSATNGVRAQPI